MERKKSQVWVETVVYTLIGLTIIGVVLSVANPQIEKIKDRGIVRQTIDGLNIMDEKISEVEQSVGSIGIVNFKVAKGNLQIDAPNNQITYTLQDSRLEYSQIGKTIREGNINITTEKRGNRFNIIVKRYYGGLDIKYDNQDIVKSLTAGAVTYKIRIENKGKNTVDSKTILDFSLL